MNSQHDKDVLRKWRESAPFWARHAGTVRSMFAPITGALIKAAAIDERSSVLDVAGGSGEPSITIAEAVAPAGSVVCTDAVAEMVRTSRDEARSRGLTNLAFTQCVGERLPFSTAAFDVVVCRLGVMLFADPFAAIHEMLRVARPGGLVGLAVWGNRASNPFFHVVADIVSRYVESEAEDPDAPGAFRFAERSKLASLLGNAGAIDVTERLLNFTLEAPLTPRQFWEVRAELSDTLREKLRSLASEQVWRLAQEVEEAGRAFYNAGRMRFPAEALIVSGRKTEG